MTELVTYTFTHDVPVPPEAVWSVLSEHESMPRWTRLRRAVLENAGAPERNGVGAVRALYLVGPPIRERITVFEPPSRLGYEAVSGIPASDYVGEVLISRTEQGSSIVWTVRFRPKFPGAQLLVHVVVGQVSQALAKKLGSPPV